MLIIFFLSSIVIVPSYWFWLWVMNTSVYCLVIERHSISDDLLLATTSLYTKIRTRCVLGFLPFQFDITISNRIIWIVWMARAQTVLQLYALTSFRNALLPIKFAAAIIIMFFLFYCNFLFYIYSMKKQVAFVVVSLFFSLFLFIISVCTSFLFKLNSHFFLSSLTSICGSAPVDDRMRTRPIVVCMRIANKQLF